ncbi:MAG: phosphoribosylformylglycinamidine cyclo-ligase [Firmicutes bacterium]|nr:phosphoribosylformylglycinamidine cyclo-ligase [Bacillota bacterium]
MKEPEGMTYRRAGVDIEAGYETVRRIRGHVQSTFRREVLMDIGSFGGFFALREFREPVLVAGTDGVGTKLMIAFMMDVHDTVGIDLVAYCVNDIICHGAEPLFFLDYLAVGKLDPRKAELIVKGVAAGCRMAGCALIGGETAEMPGFYPPDHYDLAGFAVGVVEKEKIIDGSRIEAGDVIVGIRSTGLQSSGYSLTRKVVADANLSLDMYVPEFGRTLGEELLEPTGIYAKPILTLAKEFSLHGIANISGGGMPENIPRVLGQDLQALIRTESWEPHAIFPFLQHHGGIAMDEMYKTYNMGIGMALIVPSDQADGVVAALRAMEEEAYIIGEVVPGERGVELV